MNIGGAALHGVSLAGAIEERNPVGIASHGAGLVSNLDLPGSEHIQSALETGRDLADAYNGIRTIARA